MLVSRPPVNQLVEAEAEQQQCRLYNSTCSPDSSLVYLEGRVPAGIGSSCHLWNDVDWLSAATIGIHRHWHATVFRAQIFHVEAVRSKSQCLCYEIVLTRWPPPICIIHAKLLMVCIAQNGFITLIWRTSA